MMISGTLKGAGTAGHGVGGRFQTRESASHAGLRKLAGGLALSAGCVGFTAKQKPIQGPKKNASITRFFGLGCYKSRAKSAMVFAR